jgi:hypothetical protein
MWRWKKGGSDVAVHASHDSLLKSSQLRLPQEHVWHNMPMFASILGSVALLVAVFMGIGDPKQFFFSYLVSFMFYISLALGALFFVLLHHLTRSGWSVVVRRLAEKVMSPIPYFVLLFIPVLFGIHHLYHWSYPDAAHSDALLYWKLPYLNVPFFIFRSVLYVAIWAGLARWFMTRSFLQDKTGDGQLTRQMQKWSGPAIILLALSMTFAAIDWMMTLDPHWYSTMFGVYFFSGSVIAIYAFLILFAMGMQRAGMMKGIITTEHFHDLGKLLFGFIVFWTYIAFCQYFLIWYANIPEETIWYAHRLEGSWRTVSLLLMFGHFFVPFFFLLSRHVKRNRTLLAIGAGWMLLMHYVDLYWLVMPILHEHGVHVSVLDVALLVGLGGLFVAGISWRIKQHAFIPIRDPRLAESLSFENV